MPLPSTQVIHPNWGEHHGKVSQGAANATVSVIVRDDGGGWTPEGGATPGEPVYGFRGRARLVYAGGLTREASAADQDLYLRDVTIAIPRKSGGLETASRVRVDSVDANGPQELVGRDLSVLSSLFSSFTMEQLIVARDDQANQAASNG